MKKDGFVIQLGILVALCLIVLGLIVVAIPFLLALLGWAIVVAGVVIFVLTLLPVNKK